MSAPPAGSDAVVRAMTDDGSFRVIAVGMTATVRGVIGAQAVSGPAATTLGELVMLAVLVRETMAPGLRVQSIYKLGAGGRLVADSHPGGMTRGLASLPASDRIEGGDGDLLEVVRTMPGGRLHQSIVGAPRNLAAGAMEYMQTSEQVASVVALAAGVSVDSVELAGGYIVQLLPGAVEGAVLVMTERLSRDVSDTRALIARTGADPAEMLGELLNGHRFTVLERGPIYHGCNCSEARVISALASLARSEVQRIVEEGQGLKLSCDFCRKDYDVSLEQLRALTAEPS
jgi:molecular chaperone Hsp33